MGVTGPGTAQPARARLVPLTYRLRLFCVSGDWNDRNACRPKRPTCTLFPVQKAAALVTGEKQWGALSRAIRAAMSAARAGHTGCSLPNGRKRMTQALVPGELSCLMEDLAARVDYVRQAAVLSADGLPLGSSHGLSQADAEHLAALAAGVQSLARGAGAHFEGGGIRQTVIEMDTAFLFIASARYRYVPGRADRPAGRRRCRGLRDDRAAQADRAAPRSGAPMSLRPGAGDQAAAGRGLEGVSRAERGPARGVPRRRTRTARRRRAVAGVHLGANGGPEPRAPGRRAAGSASRTPLDVVASRRFPLRVRADGRLRHARPAGPANGDSCRERRTGHGGLRGGPAASPAVCRTACRRTATSRRADRP